MPNADGTRLPLQGVRVVDVWNFLSGPYAASILGEFGAEVIEVEHPIGGDPMRRYGTPSLREDATLKWLSEARNRKSVTIDLRQAEGVALFKRLLQKSDVLIENFRPGTMEEWALGWPQVHEVNPRLVMLRVSGYGQTGPYRRSGFASVTRWRHDLMAGDVRGDAPHTGRAAGCCAQPRRVSSALHGRVGLRPRDVRQASGHRQRHRPPLTVPGPCQGAS